MRDKSVTKYGIGRGERKLTGRYNLGGAKEVRFFISISRAICKPNVFECLKCTNFLYNCHYSFKISFIFANYFYVKTLST